MTQSPIVFIVPECCRPEGLNFGAPTSRRILDVPYVSQTVSNWCWAACATMLSRFVVGSSLNICEAASTLISQGDCCVGAPPADTFDRTWNKAGCNRTCTVDEVAELHGMLGMTSRRVNRALDFVDLHTEIVESGRPVEVALGWVGGGGHVVIARGVDGGTQSVSIHDPWPDTGQIVVPFKKLESAYGLGSWFDSWTGISVAAA